MEQIKDHKRIKDFKDLFAWQEAHKLVLLVYEITKGFPKSEIFGLTNQLKRAVVSVSSNIAEGFGRQTFKEKIQFYYMAQGSLVEVKNQIIIARDVDYLKQTDFIKLYELADSSHCLLQGLIRKSKTFLSHKS